LLDKHLGAAPEADDGMQALLDAAATQLESRDVAAATEAIARVESAAPDHPALKLLRAQLAFVQTANTHPDVPALRARLELNPATPRRDTPWQRTMRWPATSRPRSPSGSS